MPTAPSSPADTVPAMPKTWKLNGRLHRTDGPAVIEENGTTGWYLHGVPHRADGPAFEWPAGRKEWIFHGALHRLDGPAVLDASGRVEWWVRGARIIDGESVSLLDHLHATDSGLLAELLRVWSPDGPGVPALVRALRAA